MVSPYTRTTWTEDFAWNEIIQEVNELATNPDEGCDPVETLEEVEENHIWNKVDVTEVQDKLKEICPDNEFTELLENQPWTIVIINEIKTALNIGWCGCQEEGVFGVWTNQLLEAHYTPNCGGFITEPYIILPNVQIRYIYPSPCYSMSTTMYNAALLLADAAFDIAHENVNLWKVDRREELLEQRKVEEDSAELKIKEALLENLQNQLAACVSDCSSIEAQIAETEAEISELETSIAEAKEARDIAKEAADAHLILANDAATENWDILANIIYWDPTFINFVLKLEADVLVPKRLEEGEEEEEHEAEWWDWGMGSHPYALPKQSKWILRGYYQTGLLLYISVGYFTPSGLPYSSYGPGRSFSYIYMIRESETRGWDWDLMEWGPWGEGGTMYYAYSQWYSEIPTPELGTYTFRHESTPGTSVVEEYDPDPDQ